ncbi:MAG: 50S ribosomal protein L22 [Acidimicrobiia bacterium]|nr:50S ribosomal protein L22 [Acidimicrobiia bacterium]
MPGPKLNDGATTVGERVGTKASAKYVRSSASKARVVLDLVRGLDVRRASEVLRFSERAVSSDIAKVLQSAVANATHNDAQDTEELYVAACYADEGPTMRRFRPRARGRATRIRKRSCHITIIVARLSDDRLEVLTNRESNRGAAGRAGTAQSRRERVERSRRRAQGLRSGDPTPAELDATTSTDETQEAQSFAPQDVDDMASAGEGSASDEPESSERRERDQQQGSASDEPESSEHSERDQAEGSVPAPEDGSIPDGYEIKGNANSMKYHVPGGRYYDITQAEVFFDSAESAEAAGYEAPAADAPTDESQGREASAGTDVNDETKTDEGSASDESDASEASN